MWSVLCPRRNRVLTTLSDNGCCDSVAPPCCLFAYKPWKWNIGWLDSQSNIQICLLCFRANTVWLIENYNPAYDVELQRNAHDSQSSKWVSGITSHRVLELCTHGVMYLRIWYITHPSIRGEPTSIHSLTLILQSYSLLVFEALSLVKVIWCRMSVG